MNADKARHVNGQKNVAEPSIIYRPRIRWCTFCVRSIRMAKICVSSSPPFFHLRDNDLSSRRLFMANEKYGNNERFFKRLWLESFSFRVVGFVFLSRIPTENLRISST